MPSYPRRLLVDRLDSIKDLDQPEFLLRGREQLLEEDSRLKNKKKTCYVACIFAIEVLATISLAVLAFFIQWMNVFPVRDTKFRCNDQTISLTSIDNSTNVFGYPADHVVFPLSLAIPLTLIILGEIGIWKFGTKFESSSTSFPAVLRRLFRICGLFILGILQLMIVSGVVRLMVGRLRPTFLEECRVNKTMCDRNQDELVTVDEICTTGDFGALRNARLSFPSSQAAVTMFAALFIVVYVNSRHRINLATVLRPCLTVVLLLLSLVCGMAGFANNQNHPSDVIVGYLFGATFSLYFGLTALREDPKTDDKSKLGDQMQMILSEQRRISQKIDQSYSYDGAYTSMQIPRAQLKKVSTVPEYTNCIKPSQLFRHAPYGVARSHTDGLHY